jgi:hypothetical protein
VKGLGGSEEVETRKRDNGQALEDVAQEVVYGTGTKKVSKTNQGSRLRKTRGLFLREQLRLTKWRGSDKEDGEM